METPVEAFEKYFSTLTPKEQCECMSYMQAHRLSESKSEYSRSHSHCQVQASKATVDEGLAPLLELLWEQGYSTDWSCQGGRVPYDRSAASHQGGIAQESLFESTLSDAHIIFTRFDDGVRFLKDIVSKSGADHVWCHNMVLQPWYDGNGANVTWRYDLTPSLTKIFQTG